MLENVGVLRDSGPQIYCWVFPPATWGLCNWWLSHMSGANLSQLLRRSKEIFGTVIRAYCLFGVFLKRSSLCTWDILEGHPLRTQAVPRQEASGSEPPDIPPWQFLRHAACLLVQTIIISHLGGCTCQWTYRPPMHSGFPPTHSSHGSQC